MTKEQIEIVRAGFASLIAILALAKRNEVKSEELAWALVNLPRIDLPAEDFIDSAINVFETLKTNNG